MATQAMEEVSTEQFAAIGRENERLVLRVRDLESIVRIRELTLTRVLAQADAMLAAPAPVCAVKMHDSNDFAGTMVFMSDGGVNRLVIEGSARVWYESDPLPRTRAAIRRQMNDVIEQLMSAEPMERAS